MKKINTDGQLTVKEFLQLEDGYYNLENPIEYVIEGSKHEPEQDDGKVKPDGEISGVITVHTDVKVLSGLMKIVTTCANDVSYYVDNVWQDGEILEVSAKDEEPDGGGEGGGGGDKLSDIVFKCDSQTLGTATCNYEVSSVWDMSADVLPVFKLVLLASDDHLNTTLYGTSVSHDVGLGGYTIGVNFILNSGASYRVVGRGNGGTWTVSKQF